MSLNKGSARSLRHILFRSARLCFFTLALTIAAGAAESGQWLSGTHYTWSGFLATAPWILPSRDYRLYIPSAYRQGQSIPLVVMLHGCKQNPENFAAGTRMNELAEKKHFLVLYPRQDIYSNIDHCWNWFDYLDQRGLGEAAIITGMVEKIGKTYSVDRRRIYVAGLSAGAAMTAILASCYSNLFAAAAIHSGVEYEAATVPWEAATALTRGGFTPPDTAGKDAYRCSGSAQRPMPVVVFHGDADQRVAPVNAEQIVRQFAQMNDYADDGKDNGTVKSIPTAVTPGQVPNGRSYTVKEYRYGEKLLLQEYRVHGMGHAWSGGDDKQEPHNDPLGPDASALIWEFFSQHSR